MAYSVAALTIFNLPMNGKYLLTLLICALMLLLTACGQRGPLYLPEPGQEIPASEDEEKDENEETA
jgi:predicted small lipoprotein YifL